MNVLIIILSIIFIILFYYFYYIYIYINRINNTQFEEYTKYPLVKESKIPNVIYTYWHDTNIPLSINKCINSWKKYNPSYKIIILNKDTIKEYIPFDVFKLKFANTHQQIADFIRIYLISEYGGFWLDSTIYINRSFDWVHSYQVNENSEFVGFKINGICDYTGSLKTPIVENWFLSAIPKSKYMLDWKDIYYSINNYNTIDDYVNFIKTKTDIKGIGSPHYLSMHIASLYVLQNPKSNYKLSLLDAEKGPFLYNHIIKWNDLYTIPIIIYFKGTEAPIVKYRGPERSIIKLLYIDRLFK
jgi:hypothetical protein